MIIYYGKRNDEFEDLELVLNVAECTLLANTLTQNGTVLNCETVGIEPAPYDLVLQRVRVMITSGLVDVKVKKARDLVFRGGLEAMSILAKNFAAFGEVPSAIRNTKGYHWHIEHYDGHFFLSPDVVPLVVASRESRLNL